MWFSCVPSLRKSCVLYSFPLLYRLWDLSWHSYNLWRAQGIIKEFSKLYFDIWKCIPYALKHWQFEIWQFSLKTRDSQKINTWVQNILFYSLISKLNSKKWNCTRRAKKGFTKAQENAWVWWSCGPAFRHQWLSLLQNQKATDKFLLNLS